MLHRCCRARLVEAGLEGPSVRLELDDRVASYSTRGLLDPLPLALRGKGYLHILLSCSSVCAANVYGEAGEELKRASGSIVLIEYERRGAEERLRVEGLESELYSGNGVVELRPSLELDVSDIERCVSSDAAKVLADKLREASKKGIRLPGEGLLGYSRILAAALLNPVARRVAGVGGAASSCVEALVARKMWEEAAPLLVAALLLEDYLERSIIVYPVKPDALLSIDKSRLGDHGEGLGRVLAEHAREASLLASKLLGRSVAVERVSLDGLPLPLVIIDGVTLHSLSASPLLALALSITAAILEKRSIILAGDAPVERLDRRTLREKLERENAVLLYTRL